MIRIFNVYFPVRALALLVGDALVFCGSFLLASAIVEGWDLYITLFYEGGAFKIICISVCALFLAYYFDLYETGNIIGRAETYFRLLLVVGSLSFLLMGTVYFFPEAEIGHNIFTTGITLLTVLFFLWRWAYEKVLSLPLLRERVYVLGGGPRSHAIVEALRARGDTGMEVLFDKDGPEHGKKQEDFAAALGAYASQKPSIDRVIVAMEDRRGAMPVRELLALRLRGVEIEDSSSLIERTYGKLPLDGLNPSNLIFAEGFHVGTVMQLVRRMVSILISFSGLLLCLPIIPLLVLAVRTSSPGPVFFRQTRIGRYGRPFCIYKFRTMRQDAEANGAVWAKKNDSRVTGLGKFMRKTRLDEIPQLWNVLRGDMAFIGPRPERPEFVQWLSSEIPFYELRHMISPGITGWAQVRYQYGASLEETRQKLEYDLYYIKHQSLGLDMLILFETIKTIIKQRGAQ